ncbi:unnamed protein product [Ectocarpus sp. CCAP 1310/34]|nr:unnamed protein product [Ectocarpus sp. CCAP 1310/34]
MTKNVRASYILGTTFIAAVEKKKWGHQNCWGYHIVALSNDVTIIERLSKTPTLEAIDLAFRPTAGVGASSNCPGTNEKRKDTIAIRYFHRNGGCSRGAFFVTVRNSSISTTMTKNVRASYILGTTFIAAVEKKKWGHQNCWGYHIVALSNDVTIIERLSKTPTLEAIDLASRPTAGVRSPSRSRADSSGEEPEEETNDDYPDDKPDPDFAPGDEGDDNEDNDEDDDDTDDADNDDADNRGNGDNDDAGSDYADSDNAASDDGYDTEWCFRLSAFLCSFVCPEVGHLSAS